jgi:hypothetical protein
MCNERGNVDSMCSNICLFFCHWRPWTFPMETLKFYFWVILKNPGITTGYFFKCPYFFKTFSEMSK